MILHGSVFSNTLDMETGITIAVPNNIKEQGKYRVAYLLHGLCGRNTDWTNYTQLPWFVNDYDVVFVMPEVYRSFYTDMKYGQKYFSYIVDELPKLCKSYFNISSKREDTYIIGASMGGYGALKCALSRPEQYGTCMAFSAACLFIKENLDRQRNADTPFKRETLESNFGKQILIDFKAMFGKELEYHSDCDIIELAKKTESYKVKPRIYTSCGLHDYMYEENLRFSEFMSSLNYDYKYEEWEGIHDWYFFDKALKRAVKQYL